MLAAPCPEVPAPVDAAIHDHAPVAEVLRVARVQAAGAVVKLLRVLFRLLGSQAVHARLPAVLENHRERGDATGFMRVKYPLRGLERIARVD